MNKNISINLGGFNLTITEEAYNKLNQYLEAIRVHYQSSEAKEILADIEVGLAGKLNERLGKNNGVIVLTDVEEVIKIMGTVEEITETDTSSNNNKNTEEAAGKDSKKRLYRSTDDVVIAGVASGLAAYFGVDTVFIRILFIVATLINGIGIMVYLVLWLVVPKAVTSAQKLEMAGRAVNLNELQNAIKAKTKIIGAEGKEAINRLSVNPVWRRILNLPILILDRIFGWLKIIISKICPVTLFIIGTVILLISFFMVMGLTIALGLALFNINSPYIVSDLPLQDLVSQPFYYIGLVSLYLSIIIPTILLVILAVTMLKRKNMFNPILVGFLAIIWIVTVTSSVVTITRLAPEIKYKTELAWAANSETRNFDFKDFSKLYVNGNIDLTVKSGNAYAITLTGDKADFEKLEFMTEDKQLQISKKSKAKGKGFCLFCFDRPIKGEIVLPKLDSVVGVNQSSIEVLDFKNDIYVSVGETGQIRVKLAGQNLSGNVSGVAGKLNLEGEVNKVELAMSGHGRLTSNELAANKINLTLGVFSRAKLSGVAKDLTINSTGHTRFDGFDLVSNVVTINSQDFSKVEVWAKDYLNIKTTDHAEVVYKGEPKISKQVSDFSEVNKWSGEDEVLDRKLYIQTDVKKYAPWMSSVRGVHLIPVYEGVGEDNVIYKWSVTQGTLVTDWNNVGKNLTVTTNDKTEPVYWTYMFDDKNLDKTEPVYIRLEAVSPNNSLLDASSIKFQINENGEAVYIGEE